MTREPIRRESTKQRSLRIPVDYVNRPDQISRVKVALTVIAVLVAVIYVCSIATSPNGKAAFSPGPLAGPHARWDADCSVCHPGFVAIRGDSANWLARTGLVRLPEPQSGVDPVVGLIDQHCQACHAGPAHHFNERPGDAQSCTRCHTDHVGRDALLSRPADIHCTRCHANLADHRQREVPPGRLPVSPPVADVTHFAGPVHSDGTPSHPDFRSLDTDPGNLKFNHRLHMTAGLPAADPSGQGRKLLALADLPDPFVARYRNPDQPADSKPDAEYPVQLSCSSCHHFQERDARSRPLPGAYAMPVVFERDCQACHPLNFEPVKGREIEHGLTPAEMRAWLLGRYQLETGSGQLIEPTVPWQPQRAIPGRVAAEAAADNTDRVADRVVEAERYLQETTKVCWKCHFEDTVIEDKSGSLLRPVQKTNIPQVWLRHARFGHASHQSLNCAECHADAAPNARGPTDDSRTAGDRSAATPRDQDIVMIAGRDVCLKCHAPRLEDGSAGVARFDCVECHQYHAAGESLLDSPSKAETGRQLLIDQFLDGARVIEDPGSQR